jgi:hypothetical protein
MKVERIAVNLRALLRANSIIADIHARHLLTRSGLAAFAALIAGFGVLMFGLAGYFALEIAWGPIWAAATVGLANCVLACTLVLVASRLKPGRDLDLAREVHKSAMAALIDEGRRVEIEFENFKQGLRSPLDLLLPGLIVPLAGFLTKSLQKRSEQAHQPKAEAANGNG